MPVEQPTLETERLCLAPLSLQDAQRVKLLAGDERIASTTGSIAHPYEDGMAEAWISTHRDGWESGEKVEFGVFTKQPELLIGAIGLVIQREHDRAELGYWIGCDYWNKGFCSEAAGELLRFGFEQLSLNKIYAQHLSRNPSSGRVMRKLAMMHEGHFPCHVLKNGIYEDIEQYGLLSSDYHG